MKKNTKECTVKNQQEKTNSLIRINIQHLSVVDIVFILMLSHTAQGVSQMLPTC